MTLITIILFLLFVIILSTYLISRNSEKQDWNDDYVYSLGKTVSNDKISDR